MSTKAFDHPALPIKPGSPVYSVVWLQEWLVARGYDVGLNKSQPRGTAAAAGIDGDMGPATLTACRNFAHDYNFAFSGIVDSVFAEKLMTPILMATSFKPTARTFGAGLVQVALAHLLQTPREARTLRDGILYGVDNSGPWVDLYMDGMTGPSQPWCMGAVVEMIDQTAKAMAESAPLDTILDGIRCVYVPRMVDEALRKGIFCSGQAATQSAITPGSIFFLKSGGSYIHTGIVERIGIGNRVFTLEGNTNDDGSANGYEFIRRDRDMRTCDYAMIA